MTKTKIVYAVEMLHYLPLYLAHARTLSEDFEIELAPAPHGDKAAINRLMSALNADRDVKFCVCDPMMVNLDDAYSATSGDWPVVIGQLVQKVPFWAVDHEVPNFSDEAKFAQFNQIFAYPSPNTGYVFGKLIHERCSKLRGGGLELRAKPIDADLDLFLTANGSVVIEADILKIRKYEESTKNAVVFSYPLHPKYNHFCFTALVAGRNFLKTSEGKEKARTLIRALHRGAYVIYNDHPLALECALARFSPRGFSNEVIDGALRQLTDQAVFSRSLTVDYRGWQKSIYVQKQVNKDFGYPAYGKFVHNHIARKEYREFMDSQISGSSYLLIRNVAEFPIIVKALKAILWVGLFVYPAFFLGFRDMFEQLLTSSPDLLLLLHFIFTFLLFGTWYFRGRLTSALRLDPADWITHGIAILVAYAVAEATLTIELVKRLTAH